jgi:hypothetical protein
MELVADMTFRDFVCSYIAEGTSVTGTKVSLGSSDPAVIRNVDRWIRRLTGKLPR